MSVLHTILLNKCSDLKLDLFDNHVTNSPSCTCGHFIESAEHEFCSVFTLHDPLKQTIKRSSSCAPP